MAGLVGPIVFGEGDDRGYFGVAELLPGRHAAVVLAIEQNSYLFVFVGVKNHSRAVQGLDRTDSFAIGLVAGGAIGGIDFFAAQRDFFYSPDFGRVIRFGGKFFLFCADPGAVVFGRHHFHMDGHVGMLLAAQLNALAVVITDFFGPKPGVADKAGNCVLFDAKRWHHKAMNHIIGSGDDADLFIHRDHHGVVHLEQVVVHDDAGFRAAIVGQLPVRGIQCRGEPNALALALDVVVAPFPLHTGGLDGEVSVGGVFHGHDHLGGRKRHQDDDDEGHDGPDDFNGGRFMKIRRLVTHRFAMFPDGIEHHAKHRQEDNCAQNQHEPVQPRLLCSNFRDRRVQVELPDSWAAGQITDCMGRRTQSRTGPNQGA